MSCAAGNRIEMANAHLLDEVEILTPVIVVTTRFILVHSMTTVLDCRDTVLNPGREDERHALTYTDAVIGPSLYFLDLLQHFSHGAVMSKTHKTNKSRAAYKKVKELRANGDLAGQDRWKNIDPVLFDAVVKAGESGRRYGNQRKMRAKMKVDDRQSERKRLNRIDPDDR
jgi:hypothetical protein